MTYPKMDLAKRIITYPIRLVFLIPFSILIWAATDWTNERDVKFAGEFLKGFYKL